MLAIKKIEHRPLIKLNFSKKSLFSNTSNYIYFQKRLIDFFMVFIIGLISSPIILYSIYRIKKESKGSILFKQTRVGKNGKRFKCYKFRSMDENSYFHPYTQDKDKRIFTYGNFMRKSRIDEIPQLWNILKGDMHLIGPRAEWDILVEKYEQEIPNYNNRHTVHPGITGLAQVRYPYGRNIIDSKNKLKYDIFYIKNWSFWLDIKIIWMTVMVVLARRGV